MLSGPQRGAHLHVRPGRRPKPSIFGTRLGCAGIAVKHRRANPTHAVESFVRRDGAFVRRLQKSFSCTEPLPLGALDLHLTIAATPARAAARIVRYASTNLERSAWTVERASGLKLKVASPGALFIRSVTGRDRHDATPWQKILASADAGSCPKTTVAVVQDLETRLSLSRSVQEEDR
jgi:hypothetical protein